MSRMIKTTVEKCSTCLYGGGGNGCSYLIVTGNRRGCPVGSCDKYEKVENPQEKLLQRRAKYNSENQIYNPKKGK